MYAFILKNRGHSHYSDVDIPVNEYLNGCIFETVSYTAFETFLPRM